MDSHKIKRGITPKGFPNESDEILSDIRHTRNRMDHTLDELGDKLQPRHLAEEAVDYFWTRERHAAGKAKDSAAQMGRKVIDEVRDHPLPALLIGAGLIWLLSQQKERSQIAEKESGPGLKEKAGEKLEAAKEKLQQGREAFRERAEEIKGTAKEKLGSAWESTKGKTSEVKEKAKGYYQQTSQSVRHAAETHPLAIGVASLAAGLMAGIMAPRTRVENKAFGAPADRIKEEGQRQVTRVIEEGRYAPGEETRREDLTPEGLSGMPEGMPQGKDPLRGL